jgi:hypothetical protein
MDYTAREQAKAFLSHFPVKKRSTIAGYFFGVARGNRSCVTPELLLYMMQWETTHASWGVQWRDHGVLEAIASDVEGAIAYAAYVLWRARLRKNDKDRIDREDRMAVLPPTQKQLDFLVTLGYDGPAPRTRLEAHDLIDALKTAQQRAAVLRSNDAMVEEQISTDSLWILSVCIRHPSLAKTLVEMGEWYIVTEAFWPLWGHAELFEIMRDLVETGVDEWDIDDIRESVEAYGVSDYTRDTFTACLDQLDDIPSVYDAEDILCDIHTLWVRECQRWPRLYEQAAQEYALYEQEAHEFHAHAILDEEFDFLLAEVW